MRPLLSLLSALVLVAPSAALAAPSTLTELACRVVYLLNVATGVLVFAAFVIYLMSIGIGLWRREEGAQLLKTTLLWGLVVLFVIASIWGILRLLQETLFGPERQGGASICANL
jgi:hypothetical protein